MNKLTSSNLIFVLKISIILFILSWLSTLYLDRNVALFINQHKIDRILVFKFFSEILPWLLTFIVLYVIVEKSYPKGVFKSIFLVIYYVATLEATQSIKTLLKGYFGRYWPKTWINNNLSLIHDGVYGFNWFHGGLNQGSFPSGHTVHAIFCYTWLYCLCPRLNKLWLLLALLVPLGLICLDYHFVGDCLAGAGLALICGNISIFLWYKIYNAITAG